MISDIETNYSGSDRRKVASVSLMIPFESSLIGVLV